MYKISTVRTVLQLFDVKIPALSIFLKLWNRNVLVGFSHIMYSYSIFGGLIEIKNSVKCFGLSKYVCLKCAKPLCNKSKKCSVPADEDSPGWKAGVSVAYSR